MKTKESRNRLIAFVVALVLFFVGFGIASSAEKAGGDVDVTRVTFVTNDGVAMSAKLYKPNTATPETPAAGILALPGGNANLENLSSLTIELSRRGFVVMAVDPYTIGRSDIVTFRDVGSRAAMDYLQGLSFVDSENMGVVGHSAGTGRAKWAATVDDAQTEIRPGVKAVMYLGAGNFNLEGVNMGVFIGTWDNTYGAGPNAGKISPRDMATAEPYTTQMGENPVQLNTWHGSVEDGTARILYQSSSGHPTALLLKTPILDTVEFFETALAPAVTPKTGIAYGWKEIGTALGILGVLIMMFPFLSLMLETPFFSGIKRTMPEPVSGVNKPFLFYLIMPAIINYAICKWAIYNGQEILKKVKILRINNTNGFVFWFACSALLTIVILAIRFKWDKKINKERILTHAKTTWKNFFKALLLGFMTVGVAYLMTYIAEVFFGLSPRIWKVQVNVLNGTRFGLFATYFPLYLLFFGIFNFSQTIGLKLKGQSEAGFTRLVWLTSAFPAGAFLLYSYGHLWIKGLTLITNVQMSRANSTLLNCILTYFITAKVTTYCYKKTGSYHTGAVINAILMTWTAVATDLVNVL